VRGDHGGCTTGEGGRGCSGRAPLRWRVEPGRRAACALAAGGARAARLGAGRRRGFASAGTLLTLLRSTAAGRRGRRAWACGRPLSPHAPHPCARGPPPPSLPPRYRPARAAALSRRPERGRRFPLIAVVPPGLDFSALKVGPVGAWDVNACVRVFSYVCVRAVSMYLCSLAAVQRVASGGLGAPHRGPLLPSRPGRAP
jgi:hypothetical protein